MERIMVQQFVRDNNPYFKGVARVCACCNPCLGVKSCLVDKIVWKSEKTKQATFCGSICHHYRKMSMLYAFIVWDENKRGIGKRECTPHMHSDLKVFRKQWCVGHAGCNRLKPAKFLAYSHTPIHN